MRKMWWMVAGFLVLGAIGGALKSADPNARQAGCTLIAPAMPADVAATARACGGKVYVRYMDGSIDEITR